MDDLLGDWLRVAKEKNLSKRFENPGSMNNKGADKSMVDTVFVLCNKFELRFEVKHIALSLVERLLTKCRAWPDLKNQAEWDDSKPLEEHILEKIVACVQLASKISTNASLLGPKAVRKEIPELQPADILRNECKVFQLLDFDLGQQVFHSSFSYLAILLNNLESRLPGRIKADEMYEQSRPVLDLAVFNRWPLMECVFRFNSQGREPETKADWDNVRELFHDNLLISSGVIVATMGVSMSGQRGEWDDGDGDGQDDWVGDQLREVVEELEEMTRIKKSNLKSLGKDIMMLAVV